ncbi:hypothetical protein ACFL35_17385 [Candidatus Riflebacteria bacterium]
MSFYKCNLCGDVATSNELEKHLGECQGIIPINDENREALISLHFQEYLYGNDKYNQFASQAQNHELVKSFYPDYGGRWGYQGPGVIVEDISDVWELEKDIGMSLKVDNMGLDFIAYP